MTTNLQVQSSTSGGEGYVSLTITDKRTGRIIDNFHKVVPGFQRNTITSNGRKAQIRSQAGVSQYNTTRVEWGAGSTASNKSDTDLASPFSSRIFTPITEITYPADNVVKYVTSLQDINVSGGFVREVGLKTISFNLSESENYPVGLLVARFVFSSSYPVNANLVLGLQWLHLIK